MTEENKKQGGLPQHRNYYKLAGRLPKASKNFGNC
jgi:hypothetical protein